MSLEKDIYKAYTDSMGGESKLDDLSKKSLKTLSSNLSKAFINFLTKQEFRIVQHEIDVSIDTIKTTSELFGDLTEDVTIEEQPLDNYNKVVKIPALDLKSSYG